LRLDLNFNIKAIIDNIIILAQDTQLQKSLRSKRSIPVINRSAQERQILFASVGLDHIGHMLTGFDILVLVQQRQIDLKIERPRLQGVIITLANANE